MRTFILYSEPHYDYGLSKSYIRQDGLSSWLVAQLEVTRSILEFGLKRDIRWTVVNGDIFEKKNNINATVYNEVWGLYNEFFEKGMRFIFNTGNHDYFLKTRNSALRPFSPIVRIVSKPTNFYFPHKTDAKILTKVIPHGMTFEQLDRPNVETAILVLHEDIQGLLYSNNYKGVKGINPDILQDWDLVLNGHIHRPQKVGNIVNVGSLIQQDFGEAEDEKQFYVVHDGSVDSFPTNGPKHYNIQSLNEALRTKIEQDEYNFYKIDVPSKVVRDEIFSKHNVYPNVVKSAKREARWREKQTTDVKEEARQYMKITRTKLNRKKLMEVFDQVTRYYQGGE